MRRPLVALALAMLSCNAHAAPFSVVLLGDSITAGGVSEPVGPSYAELLAESLGPDFRVVNVGCGGTTSLDWTTSRGSAVCGTAGMTPPNVYEARARAALPADLVTVLLGTNDAIGLLEAGPVKPTAYREAIAEIASNLLRDGAARVMLLTPPPNRGNVYAHSLVMGYRREIHKLCDGPDDAILCGPDLLELLGPDDLGDRIHPNGPGNAKIAGALRDAIRALAPAPAG